MNTKIKLMLAAGFATLVVLALVAGGWFAYTAYAQGTTPLANGFNGGCHNNQAVFDLLKIGGSDLEAQRQAGKSLLDIAVATGVSEQQLTDALLLPITAMHGWMAQNYPKSNAGQMTQYMRDWIAKDIRETKFGTMTDFRLFGGPGSQMMSGYNSYRGMMRGGNGYGGMMGRRTQ